MSDDRRLALELAAKAGERLMALRAGRAEASNTDTADESADRLIGAILREAAS